ncbi:MFS transporter [Nocardioides sp. CER19]|uniref:MFS transporter n=1 Tax=Nocardioides sp. CER19 TaxID=3038538 RepID=UPI00244A7A76|nr:MFS transporter [Nocardioides sp. CER19]MDH2416420.1 MFS transporter [Nocardioides sp. CER19]
MPGSDAGSYRLLLAGPGVARTFALALTGRLAYGLLPLLMLFTVQQATGSFGVAATTTALQGLGTLAMPLQARAVDRYGQRVVLPIAVACASLLLLTVAVAGRAHLSSAPLWWACGLALGAMSPALGPAMRTQWRAFAPGAQLTTAYALDGVCEEVIFLLGPALAGGLLALGPAWAALPLVVGLLVVGVAGLVASPARLGGGAATARGPGRPPLRSPGFLGLLLTMAAFGAAAATLTTGTAARASDLGHPAYAGWTEAAIGLGSVVGGLVWGRLRPAWSWGRAFGTLFALLGSGLLAASLVEPFAPSVVALVVGGAAMGPAFVVAYGAGDALVAAEQRTEATTWVTTFANGGITLGTAASGLLVDLAGSRTPWAAGATLAALSAVVLGVRSAGRRLGDGGGRRVERDGPRGQHPLGEGADGEREDDRPDAERSAEQQADDHDRHLERGAHQPDREAGAPHEAGHQPVAWSATELGADVHRRGQRAEHDAAEHQGDAGRLTVGLADDREGRVGARPDDERVGDRADTRLLTQRNPEQEDCEGGDDQHGPEAEPGVVNDAEVEDVPRGHAVVAADHEAEGDAVDPEPDQQLGETATEPPGAELSEGAEVGECGHGTSIGQIGLFTNSQS